MNKECDNCKVNNATFYIIDLIGGVKNELYYCQECVIKLGIPDVTNIIDLLDKYKYEIPDITCDKCGMTLQKFEEIQRVGCENDYDLFALGSILKDYHNSDQHIGKIPSNHKQQIEDLKSALNAAIIVEDFEEAAKLRDEIRKLEKE